MINHLLSEYQKITSSIRLIGLESYMAYRDETFQDWNRFSFHRILSEISDEFEKKEWRFYPHFVNDNIIAAQALFDIYTCLYREEASELCYYYSCIIAYDESLNKEKRIIGNQYRAFIFLKDMDGWRSNIEWFLALTNKYKGPFNEEFYDLSLLYDVFMAWEASKSLLLFNLKNQAYNILRRYPNYSKKTVLKEGKIAHESLFDMLKSSIESIEI